jgi:hypothetical protein
MMRDQLGRYASATGVERVVEELEVMVGKYQDRGDFFSATTRRRRWMARLALSQAVQGFAALGERDHHNSMTNIQWLPILSYFPYTLLTLP